MACSGSGAVAATMRYLVAAQCALLAPPLASDAPPADGSWYDYIVVGGGVGGATAAARLAASASVLLLEAGPEPPLDAVVPGFSGMLKGGPYDWNFTSTAEGCGAALQGARQLQPRGRMLGGSGSLNDMIYARGFPADYDEWTTTVGDQWSWDRVLPYFKLAENMTDPNIVEDPRLMRYHGRDGPIEVTGTTIPGSDTQHFLDAFREMGFKTVKDLTDPEGSGSRAGRFSQTVRGGRRDGPLPAMERARPAGLTVATGVTVERVLMRGVEAQGVLARVGAGGPVVRYGAWREVVLAAGAFNTPKLLMLSGVGPADHLRELEIDVELDLPVGEGLQDHAMVLVFLSAQPGTCTSGPGASHAAVLRYLLERSGPLAANDRVAAYMMLNETAAGTAPDIAFYPTCIPMDSDFYGACTAVLGYRDEHCTRLATINKRRELLTVAVVLLKPRSRGRVRLASRDPLVAPLIDSGTFKDPLDMEKVTLALHVVERLADTEHFKRLGARVVPLEVEECASGVAEERAGCVARAGALAAWHAVGGAAMGQIVDARLAVRGARRLRVADGAALPAVPRGSTQAPIAMIAERAAEFMLEDHAQGRLLPLDTYLLS